MENQREFIPSQKNELKSLPDWGDKPLHTACKQGCLDVIHAILDRKDNLVLYMKNNSELTPILCIKDPEIRNGILKKYLHVAEAISNQVIVALREVIGEEAGRYKLRKKNSLSLFGLFRAQKLADSMEIMMDPFSDDNAIDILEQMICNLIKHLERIEGYYGFRHPGNLYPESQDTTLIRSLYLNPIIKRILNLEAIDFQRQDYDYRITLREKLVSAFKEFREILWFHILPKILDDFTMIDQ